MVDILSDMQPKPRLKPRTQTAFARAMRFISPDSTRGRTEGFRSLLRMDDMNPAVYACAISLLDSEVEEDPSVIRETQQFKNLVDLLKLQPNSKGGATASSPPRTNYRVSLVLLEVFIYMIIQRRSKNEDEELREGIHNESEELTI